MAEMTLKYDPVSRKFIARTAPTASLEDLENITPNLLPDPSFERSAKAGAWVGWEEVLETTGFAWETGSNSHGASVLKSYATITDVGPSNNYLVGPWVRCNYGDVFMANIWAMTNNINIVSNLYIYIDWYKADKTTYISQTVLPTAASKADINWHPLFSGGTAPAAAVFCRLVIYCPGAANPTAYVWRIDDCFFGCSRQLGDPALSGRNAIINGSMRVSQRGTLFTSVSAPANSDDTYLLDRWILLSNGNNVVDVSAWKYSGLVIYPNLKAEVETANKQFGFLTILEAQDSARFIGRTVSLSFKARMAAVDDNTHSLKAVILSWTGAEDAVTSDVVDAWGATPTLVANWTAENTPASETLTTSWETFRLEGLPIDTPSAVNIAIFIYCDQTDGAVDDVVYITDVQLELGTATPFEHIPIQQELARCQRYFQVGGNGLAGIFNTGTTARFAGGLAVPMRVAPTIGCTTAPIAINPTVSEAQTASGTTVNLDVAVITVNGVSGIQLGAFSSGADGRPSTLKNDCLTFSAEL